MPTRIDVSGDGGLLVAHDVSVSLPVVPLDKIETLEKEAASGRLFVLASEDPAHFRIDLYTTAAPAPELGTDFQPLGGTFLLELPSGQLLITGTDSAGVATPRAPLPVAPGSYLLTVLERRPFDARRHEKEMRALLGESDWKFHQRANWFALAGCLPMIGALGSLLLAFRHGRWEGFFSVGLPLALLAAAPHIFHRTSGRYRRIERLMREHDAARPLFIFRLVPAEQTSGLAGGVLRV